MNILQLTLPDKHYIPKCLLSHSLLVKQIVDYNETILKLDIDTKEKLLKTLEIWTK